MTFVLISIFTDSFSYLFANQPLVENDSFIACFYRWCNFGTWSDLCVPCAKYERRYGCVGPCDRPKFKFEGKQYDYCHRFDRGDVGVTCIPRLAVPLYSWFAIFVFGKVVEMFQTENPNRAVFIVSQKTQEVKELIVGKMGDARNFLAWSRYV